MVTPVRVPRAGSNLGRVRVAVKSVRLGPTAVQAAGVVPACDAGDHAPMPTASTAAEVTASGSGRSLVRMVLLAVRRICVPQIPRGVTSRDQAGHGR